MFLMNRSLHHMHLSLNERIARLVGGCVLCGASTRHAVFSPRLCAQCVQQIEHSLLDDIPAHRCEQCAHLLTTSDPLCGACLHEPPVFTHTTAFADYAQAWQHLLLRYKFHHALHLAPVLADGLRYALKDYAQTHQPDIVILVPQQTERVQQRGFNHLQLLMQQINLTQLPWKTPPQYAPNALLRVHHAQLQVQLSPEERRKHIKNAFALAGTHDFTNQKVLVIDDIVTTGATLNEVARVLYQAGARRVDNVVLARTRSAT